MWKITEWLTPPTDHSYINFKQAKKFKFNKFLIWGLLAFLGKNKIFNLWKHFPNLFKHALPMYAAVIYYLFWCDLDQVPETITAPIKRNGWTSIYSLNTPALILWFESVPLPNCIVCHARRCCSWNRYEEDEEGLAEQEPGWHPHLFSTDPIRQPLLYRTIQPLLASHNMCLMM